MDIAGEGAIRRSGKTAEAAQDDVLTHDAAFFLDDVLQAEAVGSRHRLGEGGGEIGIGRTGVHDVGSDHIHEAAEAVVFAHEVGFAVYLDERTDGAVAIEHGLDSAFLGFAVSTFGAAGDALFAQDVDGGFHVAIGFSEGFFTVHHASIGFLAEFVDGGCGDCGHNWIGGLVKKCWV